MTEYQNSLFLKDWENVLRFSTSALIRSIEVLGPNRLRPLLLSLSWKLIRSSTYIFGLQHRNQFKSFHVMMMTMMTEKKKRPVAHMLPILHMGLRPHLFIGRKVVEIYKRKQRAARSHSYSIWIKGRGPHMIFDEFRWPAARSCGNKGSGACSRFEE